MKTSHVLIHLKRSLQRSNKDSVSLVRDSNRATCKDKCAASRLGLELFNLEDPHCQSHGFGQNVNVFT